MEYLTVSQYEKIISTLKRYQKKASVQKYTADRALKLLRKAWGLADTWAFNYNFDEELVENSIMDFSVKGDTKLEADRDHLASFFDDLARVLEKHVAFAKIK